MNSANENGFILKSKEEFKAEEFNYELSDKNMDIGERLNKLNIRPYQKIEILLKEGTYTWNKHYIMPKKSYISLYGEDYKDGGINNKVTIMINKESIDNEYSTLAKLTISQDSTAEIQGIDFIEQINRTKSIHPHLKGIIQMNGDNSRLYFAQTQTRLSNSPFIHIQGWTLARIIFGYSHFYKNVKSKESKILIVNNERGWGWGGSKAIITLPKNYYNPSDDLNCYFDKDNKNLEYIY